MAFRSIQDVLFGLTPPGNEQAEQDLRAIFDRLRVASADANTGESATPGFGFAVQDMPKPAEKRMPNAEAPSTSGWRPSLEPSERLEKQEPQNFTVPQTAPIVQTPRQQQAQAAPVRPGAPSQATGVVPKTPSPDFFDRLGAFSRGYNTGGLVGAIADGFGSGLDRQVEAQNQTAQALVKMGVAPEIVTAATRNPEIMKALVTSVFTKSQPEWDVQEIYDEQTGLKRKMLINKRNPTQTMPIGGTAKSNAENLSSGDKKAIRDAEDEIPNVKQTQDILRRALELNPQTFTGWTAGPLGWLGTALPEGTPFDLDDAVNKGLIDRDAATATREWQQLMNKEAITAMSNTLKGATTNFELQEFVKILSDPSTPTTVRERTIKRMLKLAEDQEKIYNERINEMRGGGYYRPGGGSSNPSPPPTVTPQATPQATPAPNLRGVPDRPPPGARTAPDGNIYIPDPNRPGKYLRWVPEGGE